MKAAPLVMTALFVPVAGCYGPSTRCGPDGPAEQNGGYPDQITRICSMSFEYVDSQVRLSGADAADQIPWSSYDLRTWPGGVHVAVNRAATSADPATEANYGNGHWYPVGVDLGHVASGTMRHGDYIDLCGSRDAEVTIWGKAWFTTPYGEYNQTVGPKAHPDAALPIRECEESFRSGPVGSPDATHVQVKP